MALIKCGECGKEISDKALMCIHCGNPIITEEKKEEINKVLEEDNLETKIESDENIENVIEELEENLDGENVSEYDKDIDNELKGELQEENIFSNKNKSIKIMLIVIGIILFLIVLFCFEKPNNNEIELDESFIEEVKSEFVIKNSDYDTYYNAINSDDIIITVLERTACNHCKEFRSIYTKVVDEQQIKTFSFNDEEMDDTLYNKILEIYQNVPRECGSTGKEFKLSDGFGTPLTIFTKKGEIVNCVPGKVTEDVMLEKINEVKNSVKVFKNAKERFIDQFLDDGYSTSDNIHFEMNYGYEGNTMFNELDMQKAVYRKFLDGYGLSMLTEYHYIKQKITFTYKYSSYWGSITWDLKTEKYTCDSSIRNWCQDNAYSYVSGDMNDFWNEFREYLEDANATIEDLKE